MPMSSFGEGLQKALSFRPGTYGTSLIRNHAMQGSLKEMEHLGFPTDVVSAIRDSVDCNLYFFGDKVEITTMYLVLCASILIFIGIYIAMNNFAGKAAK